MCIRDSLHLVDFARRRVDRLYVVVGTLKAVSYTHLDVYKRQALDLPRSTAFVVAILAAWRCGSSFVPIHGLPEERRRFILEEAELGALIGLDECNHFSLVPSVNPSTFQPSDLSTFSPEAWLIYTSGSSGQPKGVSVGHGGLPAVIHQQIAAFELGPGSRCLWMLSPLVDASQSDIFTALLSGATLVIAPPCELSPERLLGTLAEHLSLIHI